MRLPILVAVFLGLGSALAAQDTGATATSGPTISVSGEGSAFAAPDMATITLGVTARAKAADEAMAETSRITDAILQRLSAFDVAPRDTQTSDLSLNPVWSNRPGTNEAQRIDGFEASNRLTVRVRNLEQLGDILGEVLSDGANRLGGLSFGLQYPEPLMEEARRKAVEDAMARARTYAEAAGMTLGPVMSINEGGIRMPRPEMAMAMRDAAESVPVAGGETGITASVSMVFALESDG
ncbi:DUF541 domain-containing protein [Thalassococcus profundi]|uniref:DUF541 domain-containing protein n=1 Tax=Thalassococcus profundi TaxID=2282382 RepID=A0A369TKR2_9RHOB|nr:SIMPL domain-containing protein [Thalassococcus profundi]RDD65254.1 DUF541 domain-containing protein [Thalassococcus profundi]